MEKDGPDLGYTMLYLTRKRGIPIFWSGGRREQLWRKYGIPERVKEEVREVHYEGDLLHYWLGSSTGGLYNGRIRQKIHELENSALLAEWNEHSGFYSKWVRFEIQGDQTQYHVMDLIRAYLDYNRLHHRNVSGTIGISDIRNEDGEDVSQGNTVSFRVGRNGRGVWRRPPDLDVSVHIDYNKVGKLVGDLEQFVIYTHYCTLICSNEHVVVAHPHSLVSFPERRHWTKPMWPSEGRRWTMPTYLECLRREAARDDRDIMMPLGPDQERL